MTEFEQLYSKSIKGVLSGWDRIRFRGTIRWLASTRGIQRYVGTCGMLLKDFAHWAEAVTGRVRRRCQEQAQRLGIPTLYLASAGVDKEALARQVMQERGVKVGDICMFSTVELCWAPQVKGNRSTGLLELRMVPRKCIWIYHYWNDERVGFGHTRLQSWLPLTVTLCLNGRHWLERQLLREGIGYIKQGNGFSYLEDDKRAQQLMDEQQRTDWPALLQELLERNCPGIGSLVGPHPLGYYWSADETEWATDIRFRSSEELDRLFPKLARYGLLTAQSPAVMRFLGRCGKGPNANEVLSDLRRRYEGLRLKHWVNQNSIKAYNRPGGVLRIETTVNQTREFKVFRHPEDDPARPPSWQKMRKGVSDLYRRGQVSQASNQRYLDHLAAASFADSLQETVSDICRRKRQGSTSYRAINPWDPQDFRTLQFLARGEIQLNGLRNADLRRVLYPHCKDPQQRQRFSSRTSRRLRLLRAHALIRKVPRTHRYQLTAKGRKLTAALLAASSADTQKLMELAA